MGEIFNHHPLLMDRSGRSNLPEIVWNSKIKDRYPYGSNVELFRRSQALFYQWLARTNGNENVLSQNPMQPENELLDNLMSPAVDIIAPTFIVTQNGETKTVLIMEDHVHNPETRFTMGKTTIVQRLLRLPLVDRQVREFLGLNRGEKVLADDLIIRLNEISPAIDRKIYVPRFSDSSVKLLAGDVTFIGSSKDGKLVAMATVGTREDFLFDIARSGIRRLLNIYNRVDANIMEAQSEIATRLSLTESIWADTQKSYLVDEVVFLTPRWYWFNLSRWEALMEGESAASELKLQLLKNPLYIAGEVSYWDIDSQTHHQQVDAIMAGLNSFPKVHYLGINNPKNGFTLKSAVSLLKQEFKIIFGRRGLNE